MKKIYLQRKTNINMIILANFFISFAYGSIYILPLYVKSIHGTSQDIATFLAIAGFFTIFLVGRVASFVERISALSLSILSVGFLLIGLTILLFNKSTSIFFFLASVFIGTGWSLIYTIIPMLIVSLTQAHERAKYFSLLSVSVVLGTGLFPLVTNFMELHTTLNFHSNYILAIISLAISAPILYFAEENKEQSNFKENRTKKNNFVKILFHHEVRFPILMVFLGACVFSSMMNFQTLYADFYELNYSIYYGSYMAAVILSRLLLGDRLGNTNPMKNVPCLLMLMFAGLSLLLLNHHSNYIYSMAAIFLGASYGLVYPLIKTYAVNITEESYKKEAISFFTLSYFLGIYFFPIVVAIILNFFSIETLLAVLLLLVAIDFSIAIYLTFFASCSNDLAIKEK